MRRGTLLIIGLIATACRRAPPAEPEPKPETAPRPAVSARPVPSTPAGLECLASIYQGKVEGSGLVLGGETLAWDDGKKKTAEERLDAPDLEDMLAEPYPTGPIVKITTVDADPGRVRVERLFELIYGATEKDVRKQLVPWKLRGKVLVVHRRALPAFERVGKRIDALVAADPTLDAFFTNPGGTFNFRTIAGTKRRSAHAFGIAVDIDTGHAHYWRNDATIAWKNAIPQAIVDAFEAEQFVWGGRWWHYDTMHFEWRPELFKCRG